MLPKVTVDIDIVPNLCESASNTVEINLKRERDKCDDAPPFPDTNLILQNVFSFDPHKIQHVLESTFQDNLLCSRLCTEMAFAAEGVPAPFNMYLNVTQRFIGSFDQEEETETCAICLQDMSESVPNYEQMRNCPHEFHIHCIYMWLSKSNTCPICRTIVEDDDDDDHPYYSETEL